MAQRARRWLIGLGTVAATGASVVGQAGTVSAATTGALAPRALAVRSVTNAGPTLHRGSHGPAVTALQRRLTALHYYLGKIDGKFGWYTMEAVWAFKEVQFGKRVPPKPDIVGPLMWRQLQHPKLPRVLKPRGGKNRIEINKNTEVLVVYRYNKVALITHVSTADATRPDGNGWITPNGNYRAWKFLPGCVPDATFGGCLYNPVFFIGTSYAIHGMPNPTSTYSYDGVPLNPASHGCVRIPIDVSRRLHKLIHIGPRHGSRIYIRGPKLLYWSP